MRCQLANAGPRKTPLSLSLSLSLSFSLSLSLSLSFSLTHVPFLCSFSFPLFHFNPPFSVSVFFYHHLPSIYLALLLLCFFSLGYSRSTPSPTIFFYLSCYISLPLLFFVSSSPPPAAHSFFHLCQFHYLFPLFISFLRQ